MKSEKIFHEYPHFSSSWFNPLEKDSKVEDSSRPTLNLDEDRVQLLVMDSINGAVDTLQSTLAVAEGDINFHSLENETPHPAEAISSQELYNRVLHVFGNPLFNSNSNNSSIAPFSFPSSDVHQSSSSSTAPSTSSILPLQNLIQFPQKNASGQPTPLPFQNSFSTNHTNFRNGMILEDPQPIVLNVESDWSSLGLQLRRFKTQSTRIQNAKLKTQEGIHKIFPN
jgi:hypothetical protein